VAVSRVEALRGHPVGLGRHVVVIGDTPHDVDCALHNGCTAVGVGAARWSATELADAGAHATLGDLTDTAAVIRALGLDRG
jgi:phosphoglycolate phosphatase-like HAD superfamily hydrolase